MADHIAETRWQNQDCGRDPQRALIPRKCPPSKHPLYAWCLTNYGVLLAITWSVVNYNRDAIRESRDDVTWTETKDVTRSTRLGNYRLIGSDI